MAINIKELFVTDLNPNSGAWWSKDKVDKINYNFSQLSNGGTPGPQGTIGEDAGFGPTGDQGYTGYKGPQGYQGLPGTGGLNDWVYFPETNGLPGYLYPRKNPINIIQSAPVALRIGYLSTDALYHPVGAEVNEPIQIVKTNPNNGVDPDRWVNLRVEDSGSFNGYNFGFGTSTGFLNGNPKFEISPNITSSNFKIIWTAKDIAFKTAASIGGIAAPDSIIINDSQITGNILFNLSNDSFKTTKAQSDFIFTPGAVQDSILVSTDNNGNLAWKNVKDVFGTFPIGSIISIRPSEFSTTHFWLNDSRTVEAGYPLNNIYGRGKIGTDYEGWYICNGETWETEQGFNQILTPNLNNFSYTINDNGDFQNSVTIPEPAPVLIGGYDIKMTATPDSSGVYSISYNTPFLDNDTSPGDSIISMGSSGLYETSRMIHIVYLGLTNLKWSNTGVYVPPSTTNSIMLTTPANIILCDEVADTTYSWSGPDDVTWNTFTPLSAYKLFNFGTTTYAPSGWYINVDGYPIRWDNITGSFVNRGATCVPNQYSEFNLRTSLLVDDLNGPLGNFGGTEIFLDYNTPLFINATTLKWADNQNVNQVGSNAEPGWYRDTTTGVRRYWNGNSFVGLSFNTNYVIRVIGGNIDNAPGYNREIKTSSRVADQNGEPIGFCELPQDFHLTYIAGNDDLTYMPQQTLLQNIVDYDSAIYVTVNWAQPDTTSFFDTTISNTPPLINVKDQNRPGQTNKYTKIYIESYLDYGFLSSTTGKITAIDSCQF